MMDEETVMTRYVTGRPPEAIELCCGAGGLSYGLASSGIRVLAGVDTDARCRYPFEPMWGAIHPGGYRRASGRLH